MNSTFLSKDIKFWATGNVKRLRARKARNRFTASRQDYLKYTGEANKNSALEKVQLFLHYVLRLLVIVWLYSFIRKYCGETLFYIVLALKICSIQGDPPRSFIRIFQGYVVRIPEISFDQKKVDINILILKRSMYCLLHFFHYTISNP